MDQAAAGAVKRRPPFGIFEVDGRKMTDIKNDRYQRTRLLIGDEALKKLAGARVAVFGLGGVGSYACEAIARAGVGTIIICDDDTVDITNINRQLVADMTTIGSCKTDVEEERILRVNPDAEVEKMKERFEESSLGDFDFESYDYVVDAIDSVASKLLLIKKAHEAGTPIISAMGAGGKLNPAGFEVADISKTSVDPLARTVRQRLRKEGIKHTKVVYSKEQPVRAVPFEEFPATASISFVPPAVGLIMASEVIKGIISTEE